MQHVPLFGVRAATHRGPALSVLLFDLISQGLFKSCTCEYKYIRSASKEVRVIEIADPNRPLLASLPF